MVERNPEHGVEYPDTYLTEDPQELLAATSSEGMTPGERLQLAAASYDLSRNDQEEDPSLTGRAGRIAMAASIELELPFDRVEDWFKRTVAALAVPEIGAAEPADDELYLNALAEDTGLTFERYQEDLLRGPEANS
jgi:hypothetical protein